MLSGLLAAAPDALLAVSTDGIIVFANDQAERLFGWPKAELVGEPVECLVPGRFAGRHRVLRHDYAAAPVPRPMDAGLELRARRRDGTEFPAEISLSTFATTDGTKLVAAAIRDVTVARRAEQRFRAVLASAPDAIVGVGDGGRIELVNEQAVRLFGWSADELVGQHVEILVPVPSVDAHVALRAGYVADARPRQMGPGLDLFARRKDGSTFPAEISLNPVSDEYGSRLVLAAVRDVSDRRELEAERQRRALEAQREQSHRMESLGQLAGGVAHDFNNLLGVILNYNTLLTHRVTDPSAIADLGEIRAAAERGAGLTRQLLTFARRDVVNHEPLDVNDVVRGVASMLERTLGELVELRVDLAGGQLVAIADSTQLEQIVLNLAINARDAMPEGGSVTITTERVESDVVLRVIDMGCGMPPEVVARAFEPFYTTKRTGEGTGLGLATVYGIVRQLGGEVTIDSTIGAGTVVSVALPGADQVVSSPRQLPGVTGRGSERILLVEDEASLRVGTARLLAEQGYEVVTACDGVDALEICARESEPFALFVTDVAMPRMRGDELGRCLKATTPGVRIIFMSGYDSGPAPLTGRLLPKPVPAEILLRTVREVLDG